MLLLFGEEHEIPTDLRPLQVRSCQSLSSFLSHAYLTDPRRSVSYCNKTCQIADYKRGHKRECQEFIHPPFVPDFVPEAIGDMKYERNPVFALGHNDGVGCWVSISGRADAE